MLDRLKKVFEISNISKSSLFLFSFLFFILSLLELFGIGLVGLIIERVFSDKILSIDLFLFSYQFIFNEYEVYVLVGLVYLFKTILAVIINFIIYKYTLNKTSDLRVKIVSSYFLNLNNLNSHNNNEIINSINGYCEDFYQIFFLVHRLLSDVILAVFLFIYLSYINFYIFIFFIIATIIFIFSYYILIKLNIKFGFNVNKSRYSITKELRDTFAIKKEIFIYNKINTFLDYIKISSYQIARNQTLIKLISSSPRLILELIFILCILITLIFSIDNFQIDYFLIGIVFIITIKIIPVAQQFLNFISSLNSTSNSIIRINNLINKKKVNLGTKGYNKDNRLLDIKIIFDKYINVKISKNFKKTKTLTLSGGHQYFIGGASGAGKSTFVEKIIGLRKSNFKFYHLGNKQKVKINDIRNFCSYVPQSSQIVNNSIIFNITLTSDQSIMDDIKLRNAIEICELNNIYKNFKYGIYEIIGENGKKLSGGEIQRISLARALYFKKEILILDESTSALNNKLEIKILNKIKLLYKNDIFIIISHNKDLKKLCDKEIIF